MATSRVRGSHLAQGRAGWRGRQPLLLMHGQRNTTKRDSQPSPHDNDGGLWKLWLERYSFNCDWHLQTKSWRALTRHVDDRATIDTQMCWPGPCHPHTPTA